MTAGRYARPTPFAGWKTPGQRAYRTHLAKHPLVDLHHGRPGPPRGRRRRGTLLRRVGRRPAHHPDTRGARRAGRVRRAAARHAGATRSRRCGCSTRWAARPPWPRPAPATSASSRRHAAGGARQRLAGGGVGPERRAAGDVPGGRQAARGRPPLAARRAAAAASRPGSRSSAARRWPTPRASPRHATHCSPGSAGTCRRRAVRRTAGDGGDRRAGALDAVQVARARRSRSPPCRGGRPTTRGGCAPTGCPTSTGPVLVCAQAGEVNTGAFDPFEEIADWLAERSGWLHVDGAFGLWALADPTRRRSSGGSTAPTRGPPTATSG